MSRDEYALNFDQYAMFQSLAHDITYLSIIYIHIRGHPKGLRTDFEKYVMDTNLQSLTLYYWPLNDYDKGSGQEFCSKK